MIYIHGGNKDQRRLSRQLFNFCCNGLFHKNNLPTIDLNIHKVEDALAWTDYEGEGRFIITMCHEMIHVCQFLAEVEVSELSAYHYEEKLAEQFYHEELERHGSELDLNED
jgi:hypothetical protein